MARSGVRIHRSSVCAFAITLLIAHIAQAQPALANQDGTAAEEAVPVRQADRVFTYPGDTSIRSIHPGADGEHIYALFQVGSVNLWAVLVYHWVEIAALAGGITAAMLLWRLLRRRQEIGQPHCRKCNYLLVNFSGDCCPECGAQLTDRNRVTARPRGRRIAVLAAMLLVVFGGYLTGRSRLPREGAAGEWFLWLSPRLYDWAWHHGQAWLHERKSWILRVVEIDVVTGAVTRTIHERPGGFAFGMDVASDGRSIALALPGGAALYDSRSGERLGAISLAENQWANLPYDHIQALTVDGATRTVYFALMSGSVQAWDPVSDRVDEIVKLESRPLGGFAQLQFLSERNQLMIFDWWAEPRFSLRLWSPQTGSVESEWHGTTTGAATGVALIEGDGRLLVTDYSVPEVQVRDASTGALLTKIAAPARDLYAALVSDQGRLFFATQGRRTPAVRVYDLLSEEWIADLRGPVTQVIGNQVVAMPDGHTVVALGWDFRQGYVHKILVWDLGEDGRQTPGPAQ